MEQSVVSIKECFDFLYLNKHSLTAYQAEFVEKLKTYYNRNKCLSDKQITILFEIRKYLKVNEQVRFTNKKL